MTWVLSSFLMFLIPFIAVMLYGIYKKLEQIVNLMQGKPIDYKEDKKKKEQE